MDKKIEELIERLKSDIDWQDRVCRENNLLSQETLQSQAQEIERLRNPWVPIAYILEEWKDGRVLWLLTGRGDVAVGQWAYDNLFKDYRFVGTAIEKIGLSYEINNQDITHAMLPPTPPKDT